MSPIQPSKEGSLGSQLGLGWSSQVVSSVVWLEFSLAKLSLFWPPFGVLSAPGEFRRCEAERKPRELSAGNVLSPHCSGSGLFYMKFPGQDLAGRRQMSASTPASQKRSRSTFHAVTNPRRTHNGTATVDAGTASPSVTNRIT